MTNGELEVKTLKSRLEELQDRDNYVMTLVSTTWDPSICCLFLDGAECFWKFPQLADWDQPYGGSLDMLREELYSGELLPVDINETLAVNT